MDEVVEVDGLEQSYGSRVVLSNINLHISRGQIVALIGPSGAGKTTLVAAVMGMLRPSQGLVRVLGTVMPNRRLLGQIGFMAQTDALYASLSGRANLTFFARLQRRGNAGVEADCQRAAAVVGLTADLDQPVAAYSGGMRRRLSLAIALVGKPQLLILDEPTVGIDPELRLHIWQELRRLAAAGVSILLTTHVMADAEQADRVLMIRQGRLIAQGSRSELLARYRVDSVEAAFLAAGRSHAEPVRGQDGFSQAPAGAPLQAEEPAHA